MMLLLCFDLPRNTKVEQKAANKFRKHLVGLGFTMKQYSLYERPIKRLETRDRLIKDIMQTVPDTGAITLYELPMDVNDNQITILGCKSIKKISRKPQLIIL